MLNWPEPYTSIQFIYGNHGREHTKYMVHIYGSGQPYWMCVSNFLGVPVEVQIFKVLSHMEFYRSTCPKQLSGSSHCPFLWVSSILLWGKHGICRRKGGVQVHCICCAGGICLRTEECACNSLWSPVFRACCWWMARGFVTPRWQRSIASMLTCLTGSFYCTPHQDLFFQGMPPFLLLT